MDVAIEHNESLSSQFPGLRKEDRHGFTLVLTAWRHAARDSGECEETEMVCPNTDGGAHRDTSHCIWQKMYCDGHQVSCQQPGPLSAKTPNGSLLASLWQKG